MPRKHPEIFISYSWNDEGLKVADDLERCLQEQGFAVMRDNRAIGYKGLIKEYMQRLGRGKCIILVLSDQYFKSPNCMYELLQITQQPDFQKRIFPVIVDGTLFYRPEDRLKYLSYWDEEKTRLQEEIRQIPNLANLHGITDDLDLYDDIRRNIARLLDFLRNLNTYPLQGGNYEPLLEAIQSSMTQVELDDELSVCDKENSTEDGLFLRSRIAQLRQKMTETERVRRVTRQKSVGVRPAIKIFVNRIPYLDRLNGLLLQNEVRIILITGHSGIGKTAIAAKFCDDLEKAGYCLKPLEGSIASGKIQPVHALVYVSEEQMAHFSLPQLFEKLLQTFEADEVERLRPLLLQDPNVGAAAKDLMAARDMGEPREPRDPGKDAAFKTCLLLDALPADLTLLVLDNFDTLLDEQGVRDPEWRAFLETVSRTQSCLKILITSRANVNLEAFEGLAAPLTLCEGLEDAHAVEYLRKIGHTIPQIVDAPDEELAALAQKVYGIPLALRSLTVFLKQERRLTVADLLEEPERFADFREHDYERGLRRLLSKQYNLLSEDARLALQVLAVFNKSVPPVAMQYVCPGLEAEVALDCLERDYFLAQRNPLTDEFELHSIIREFVYEQIPVETLTPSLSQRAKVNAPPTPKDWTRAALHGRAADFYAELRKPQDEWRDLSDVQPQLDEIEQRIAAGDYDYAARVLEPIDFDYLHLWGYSRMVIAIRAQLLGKLTKAELMQRNYGNLGLAYDSIGRIKEAIPLLKLALAIAFQRKDIQGVGAWLSNLGLMYAGSDDLSTAIECYEQAITISRETGHRRGEGASIGDLGKAYYQSGNLSKAMTHYEQALTISREIGDRRNEGIWLGNLGKVYEDSGNLSRAMTHYEQALAISRDIGDRRSEGIWLGNLGKVYEDSGNLSRAMTHYEQALAISRDIGDRRSEGIWLGNLGKVYEDSGNLSKAMTHYEQALAISRDIGDQRSEGIWLGNLGIVCSQSGKLSKAMAYYEHALAISREIGDRQGERNHLGNLGHVYRESGSLRKAIKYYKQALAISREIGDRQNEGRSVGNLGIVFAEFGDLQNAMHYYEQALTISREIGDRQSESNHLGNLGRVYRESGDLQKAIEHYKQALGISREIGDRRSEGILFDNLALAYKKSKDWRNAIVHYDQALTICRETQDRRREGTCLGNLGNAYRQFGDLSRAIEHYEQALAIHRETGDRHSEGTILGNLGSVYYKTGNLSKAIDHYEQALTISREIGNKHSEGKRLIALGVTYAKLGDLSNAIEFYKQALAIAQELGDPAMQEDVLHRLGHRYQDQRDWRQAMTCWEQALKLAQQLHDLNEERLLLGDLGRTFLRRGKFSRALGCFKQAWQANFHLLVELYEKGMEHREIKQYLKEHS